MRHFLQSHIISLLVVVLFGGFAFGQGAGKGEYIVGTGVFTSTDVPVYPWYGYSYTQTIYLQSELDFSGQMIDQVGYQYAGTDNNLELEIEIWLEHTSMSTINSTVQLTNSTKVYDGPWNLTAGEDWSMIIIDPFVYNNSDNLLLTIIEKKPGYNSLSDAFYADFISEELVVGNQNDFTPYDPNNLPSSLVRVMRANTKFVTSDIPAGPAVSQITPTTLDFGDVGLGIEKTLSVQIKNTGSDPLEVTGATSSNSQFSVINTTFPFTLGAAGSQNVEIEFMPVDETSETGTIEFLFDAGIAGDREVQVSGNGIIIMDVVVGTGTFESYNAPVYPYYGYSFTQTLYLQPELNFQDKQIHRIGYQYNGNNNNLELNIEVWMKHTSANQITSTLQLDDFTKVYDGPWFVSPGGFSEIDIDPFIYNNTDNLIVTIIEKRPGYNASSDKFYGTSSGSQSLCRGAWNDGSAYDPDNLPSGSAIAWRPNTKFWFEEAPEGPAVSQITPAALDFGELVYGENAMLPVAVKNIGVDPLEITGYNSSNSHFTLVGAAFPITLGYNQQQEFDVLFQPTTTDAEAGTITFEMDPLIEGDKEVAVSGQMAEYTISEFPWLEGFDDGLPEGWQNQVVQAPGWDFFSSPFTHTVIYNFPGSPANAANLITPLIDLTGLDNPRLGMNNMFYYYQSSLPVMAELQVSTDGMNWETLYDFTGLINNNDYNYEEFDLSAYAGQQIYLAFAADFPDNNTDFYEVVWEIEHVTVYNFIPTYNVTFNVEDPDGNPLNDATVTFDDVTNAPGDYSFTEIQAGTYDYSVALTGYVTAVGEVTVTDEDVNVNVALNLPDLITEFPWFEGFDAGALPEGWQNVVNQGNGWDFALGPYSHTYIYAFGGGPKNAMLVTPLLDLSGLSAATLEIYHRIYASGTGWSHKILMSPDSENWETIAEFTEGFNPDINMYMEFEIPQQAKAYGQVYLAFAIDYPELPDYYEVVWEIVDIEVFGPMSAFNVNFAVEDEGGNSLNDAIITLDGNTNAPGDYLFEEIEPGTYDYSVELDGYITAEGQVELVDQDVEEIVVLQEDGQHIALLEGWSLISSYQNIENPDLMAVFDNQVQAQNIVILVGSSGIFWPGYNVNTIGDWNPYEGYKIKMLTEDMLIIPGSMVEDRTVELPSGVSYLPVLSDVPVDAEAIFSQVGESLQYAFDLVSGTIYWPDGGIYSLETLQPGIAYIVSMTAPGTVSFDGIDNAGQRKQTAHSQSNANSGITNTGVVHLVSITAEALVNNLAEGAWIGAYNTQEECVGKSQYLNPAENLGMVVYGDDPTTDALDGLSDGEQMILKVIDPESGETTRIEPEWNNALPQTGYFAENGLSAIASFKLEALAIGESNAVSLSLYPNPASETIHVSVENLNIGHIKIMNHTGQQVIMTDIKADKSEIDVSSLSPGVYFVRLINTNTVLHTEKLIIR